MSDNFKSEGEVDMQVPTSSTWSNTDGRTDVRTKNLLADVDQLTAVDARWNEGFAAFEVSR